MNRGILFGIGAYLVWGFMPIWLKQIQGVPALQILSHRVAWSFVLLAAILVLRRQWIGFKETAGQARTIAIYSLAAMLLGANWLTYILAVNSNHIVESSLGYFINPLVSVLLGVVFLRERLRPWQWLPVGIASAGVLYLTIDYGRLPWIALALAFTFALYGLVKKTAPLGSLYGLTLETSILFVPVMTYLVVLEITGSGWFTHHGWVQDVYLAAAGLITTIPLLLFGSAARKIPLSMLGLLQYIAPTCQFGLGVLVYHEPFSPVKLVGFSIIWLALVLFWTEGYLASRKQQGEFKHQSSKPFSAI
jgi:chloramphenicol-sensitive protein RarD